MKYVNVTIGQKVPSVIVNTSNITYGDVELVNVTVPFDAIGSVVIVVYNDNGYSKSFTLPVIDGVATLSVAGLVAGDYYVNVTYSGDGNYYAHDLNGAVFTVNKANTTISNIRSIHNN